MVSRFKDRERNQRDGDEALVRYFRPILKRFLRLAYPGAFRSQEAMQQTFGYRAKSTSTHSEHDGDDSAGMVSVSA